MFDIKKNETVSKTFRMPKALLDKLVKVADQKDVSLSSVVIQCCEYALNNMNDDDNHK